MKHFRKFLLSIGMAKIVLVSLTILLSPSVFCSYSKWSAITHAATSITQTTGAGNLGTNITQTGNIYGITGGKTVGTNLFHSFAEFSIATGDIAQFQTSNLIANPAMSNILSRVTGGNPSAIFGALDSATYYPSANLFLMNPAGFLFGPNATVNVGGMVHVTTADYLKLADENLFKAIPDAAADALLTTFPVAAYGFLGSNPAAIALEGSQLTVANGTGISLIGGNRGFEYTDPDTSTITSAPDGVTLTAGNLSAPGGQLNLASVASPGEMLFPNLESAPNIHGQSFAALGNITLSQGTILDVSADAAGTVRVRGGQLVMDQATISADTGNANGSPVAIDVNVAGDISISTIDIPALNARTTGVGDAGEIRISSQNLDVAGAALDNFIVSVIDTHTSGSGKAGDVSITATDHLTVAGENGVLIYFIDSGTVGPDGGHGGNVELQAKNMDFQFTNINTGDNVALNNFEEAAGSGGNLIINATSLNLTHSILGTDAFAGGRAGNLEISSNDVQMTGSSGLSATGIVSGGKIEIAADHLAVDDSQIETNTLLEDGGGIIFTGRVGEFTNGSIIQSSTFGDGNAGNIGFTATERLTFSDNTSLDGAPLRPSGLFTTAVIGNGNAAEITVNTPLLELRGGARFDASTGSNGNGGGIDVVADNISIIGERPIPILEGPIFGPVTSLASGIYSSTVQSEFCVGACGNAGPLSITTGSLTLAQGGRLDTSSTSAGRGGEIMVNANQISISGTTTDGFGSGIFTDTQGTGAGGIISINSNTVTLSNGGQLSATTSGTEPSATGGTITVNANQVQVNTGGLITASTTGAGEGGSVNINAASTFASNAGMVSSTATQAAGGAINITTGQSVTLNNGSLITASSNGEGNAGNILINAGQQYRSIDSSVTTKAVQASGGNITVLATGLVHLTNSELNASVEGSSTTVGGNILIDPLYVIIENSKILAQATQGQGGNINIFYSGAFLVDPSSLISASSQFGQQGTVTIQSPISPASGKIIPIGQKPLIAASLLSQRCAALAGGNISSFTVAGRDALPAEPGGWLSSPLALAAPSVGAGLEARSDETDQIDNQTHEFPLLSLRQIGPTGFLTQVFAVESAGCSS
jgi:filamentous hemagglutinin family protein